MLKRCWHALDLFFPERDVSVRRLPLLRGLLLFLVFTILFSLAATLIPENGFFGFDWFHFFGVQNIPAFYPPWTAAVVQPLNYPLLIGISLAAFSIAVIQRSVHPFSAAASFFCLPLLWTVFLGQLEGLSVLGLLGLPWLLPLALVKPQIAFFALGARRQYILLFFILFLISLLIWKDWPATMLAVEGFYTEGRYPQNIGLGWWGVPLFALTVWFSRGDVDMLMLSGAFISPHVIFYNLLPLTPAVARLKPRAALAAVFLSYLTFSANWLGPAGWWLGWGFVPWVWLNLAIQRYPDFVLSRWYNQIIGKNWLLQPAFSYIVHAVDRRSERRYHTPINL